MLGSPRFHQVIFRNDADEDIPAFAIMQVTGSVRLGTGAVVVTVDKPDGEGQLFYLNGKTVIPTDTDNEKNFGVTQDTYPAWGLVAGSVSGVEERGPVANSWKLEPEGTGFLCMGPEDTDEGACLVEKASGLELQPGLIIGTPTDPGRIRVEKATICVEDSSGSASGGSALPTGSGVGQLCDMDFCPPTQDVSGYFAGTGEIVTALLLEPYMHRACIMANLGQKCDAAGSGSAGNTDFWVVLTAERITECANIWYDPVCCPDGSMIMSKADRIKFIGEFLGTCTFACPPSSGS